MVVLDPMIGSGTTAWVSRRLGRNCVGYDINPDYLRLASQLIVQNASETRAVRNNKVSSSQAVLIQGWQNEESRPAAGSEGLEPPEVFKG